MLPYITAYILTIVFFKFYFSINRSEDRLDFFHLFLTIVPLLVLGTFRDSSIGTDTAAYLRGFYANNDALVASQNISLFSEPGFLLVTSLISQLFEKHIYYFFTLTFSILFLYLKSILKIAKYPTFSLICFLLLGVFTFHFNGARQGITLAIFAFSLIFILEKRQCAFYLSILFGFLFHKSILICIPFYYIFNVGFTKYTVSLITIGFTLFGVFISNVVELASGFDERYSSYGLNQYEGGGVGTVVFNIAVFAWLILAKVLNNIRNKIYDVCLVAMLCSCSLGAVSILLNLNPSGILRLTQYFSQFLIFSLPISIMAFRNEYVRIALALFSIIFMSIYCYLITISFSKLHPYTFALNQ